MDEAGWSKDDDGQCVNAIVCHAGIQHFTT